MATVTRTYMVDDLDGSEGDVSTVQIALDKVNYEIDLSDDNAERLREQLAKFVDNGTLVTPSRGTKTVRKVVKSGPASREQTTAVREWARSQGLEVSERGRISKSVQEAFEASH